MPPPPKHADARAWLDRDPAQIIIDMVREEVDRTMDNLEDRLHNAEDQLDNYVVRARYDLAAASTSAANAIKANPLPTSVLVIGADLVIASFVILKKAY